MTVIQDAFSDVIGEGRGRSDGLPEPVPSELPVLLADPAEPSFSENEVRDLVAEAIRLARRTQPSNMSDEACIQRTMKDRFIEGYWRSTIKFPTRPRN